MKKKIRKIKPMDLKKIKGKGNIVQDDIILVHSSNFIIEDHVLGKTEASIGIIDDVAG